MTLNFKRNLFFSSGLSVGSKGGMSVAGSTDNNMESLVEYHKEMVSKKNDSMGELKELVLNVVTDVTAGESVEPEALNKKALDIVQRVRDKLTGKDFNTEVEQLRFVS